MNPRFISVRTSKILALFACLSLIILAVFQMTDMVSGREIELLEDVPVVDELSQNMSYREIDSVNAIPNVTTLNLAGTSEVTTLDPQAAEDSLSVDYIENLFVNLINFDPATEQILPEAATAWEISTDSMVYTFTVRTDIPWVKHDLNTGLTTQVVDGSSNPRFVTANDFIYSIKRACDPNVGGYYSSVIAPQIKGCSDVLNYSDPANIPPSLFDAIGVSAPTPDVLVIEMAYPAGHFMSMVPMWTLAATPQWIVEAYGEMWTDPVNIVTSGRYVIHEWNTGISNSLWRNPLMPVDMQGVGNIEQIITTIVLDIATSYSLWLNDQVAVSNIPNDALAVHLANYPSETDQIPDLAVFYFGFRTTKPPFDNVHVRRAFSAAFDRQMFINQYPLIVGRPMKHFAPPGIFGAPPIDQVGVGSNITFAQNELALAGYPGCGGFPTISFITYSGDSAQNLINYSKEQWVTNLGCNPDLIQIEQLPFSELLLRTSADTPDEEAPHVWTLGWGPDYADENNWVGDDLHCGPNDRNKRACSAVDDLIDQAEAESNPATRIALYTLIEEGFFGVTGEYPIAPLWARASYVARHSWLARTPVLFGGEQWYNWEILPSVVSDIIPTSGGVLSSTLGATTYSFPAGTFTDSVIVTHTTETLTNVPSLGDFTGIGHYYDVSAVYEVSGLPAQPDTGQTYTVTITYSDVELGSAFESTLALYYWDGSEWVLEPTSVVDSATNTVTATPDHFSSWAILGTSEEVYLPVVLKD